MKRRNFLSKTTGCLLVLTMSLVLFAGCQSKNTASSTNQTSTGATKSNKKLSADEMKKRMQDNIKPLVTAGTITQDQSDKIVEALTTDRPKGDGQNKTKDNTEDKQTNQQNDSGSNGNSGNNATNGQNKSRNNPLSKLVSDGVITQAQADAVMEKVRGNFNRKNNNQTSQNGSTQSSN